MVWASISVWGKPGVSNVRRSQPSRISQPGSSASEVFSSSSVRTCSVADMGGFRVRVQGSGVAARQLIEVNLPAYNSRLSNCRDAIRRHAMQPAKKENVMERTLVLLKPDCVQRRMMGQIISRFEDKGLNIIAAKML